MNTRTKHSDHVQLLTIDDIAERLSVSPDRICIVHQFEDQELQASRAQSQTVTQSDEPSTEA